MAGAGVRYSDGAIATRTNVYAEREMLKHALPVMVLEKLAVSKSMPKNKTDTIKFRRPIVFSAVTTPLVEGVTPDKTAFAYEGRVGFPAPVWSGGRDHGRDRGPS